MCIVTAGLFHNINCLLYIQHQKLARLQNNDEGGIRRISKPK